MGHVDVGHRWDRVAMDQCLLPLRKAIVHPGNGGLFFLMDGSVPVA